MDDITRGIILTVGVYEGVLIWLWAVRHLCLLWRDGGARVSTFIVFLILSDLIDASVTPLVFQKILGDPPVAGRPEEYDDVWGLSALFFGTRVHALYLNQLVTLECVLCFRHNHRSGPGGFLSPSSSMAVSVSAWAIISLLSHLCSTEVSLYVSFCIYVALCSVPMVMSVITCVLALKRHPVTTHQASSPVQRRRRQAAMMVTAISMATLVVVYLPYLTLMCLAHSPWYGPLGGHPFHRVPEMAWLYTMGLVGLRVMADPLLCILVCEKVKSCRPNRNEGGRRRVNVQAGPGAD